MATYDQKPEMSAAEVASRFAAEIGDGYRLRDRQLREPGHGRAHRIHPGGGRAVETVDACLGRVVEAVERVGGVCLVTADHGNAEQMLEPDGMSPHTAHTTNPSALSSRSRARMLADGGELADLVPTCLDLLGIPPSAGDDRQGSRY